MPPWFTKVCQMIWANYPLERKQDVVENYCAVARDARAKGKEFFVPTMIVDIENNVCGSLEYDPEEARFYSDLTVYYGPNPQLQPGERFETPSASSGSKRPVESDPHRENPKGKGKGKETGKGRGKGSSKGGGKGKGFDEDYAWGGNINPLGFPEGGSAWRPRLGPGSSQRPPRRS